MSAIQGWEHSLHCEILLMAIMIRQKNYNVSDDGDVPDDASDADAVSSPVAGRQAGHNGCGETQCLLMLPHCPLPTLERAPVTHTGAGLNMSL